MKAPRGTCPPGFTLMEMLIVLALLGLLLGVGAAALRRLDPVPESPIAAELRRARAEAVKSGRPVQATAVGQDTSSGAAPILPRFFPDGSARGPGVDPLTGVPYEAE